MKRLICFLVFSILGANPLLADPPRYPFEVPILEALNHGSSSERLLAVRVLAAQANPSPSGVLRARQDPEEAVALNAMRIVYDGIPEPNRIFAQLDLPDSELRAIQEFYRSYDNGAGTLAQLLTFIDRHRKMLAEKLEASPPGKLPPPSHLSVATDEEMRSFKNAFIELMVERVRGLRGYEGRQSAIEVLRPERCAIDPICLEALERVLTHPEVVPGTKTELSYAYWSFRKPEAASERSRLRWEREQQEHAEVLADCIRLLSEETIQ